LPAYEFAGYVALRDEMPVLDEEERYAVRNLVRIYPQWAGPVVARWTAGPEWGLRLSQNEKVRWLNEGRPPTPSDLAQGALVLHNEGKGYLLCPTCGNKLNQPLPPPANPRGRRAARGGQNQQVDFGHARTCPNRAVAPTSMAITTAEDVEVLRLLVPLPATGGIDDWHSWGLTLGYALLNGMQHFFMLGSNELDFELEGGWLDGEATARYRMLSLAFIDPSLGGSGYLRKIADEFHNVAKRTLDHLDHPDCETACYRCLKSYQNQRYHDQLEWPKVIDALNELAAIVPRSRPLEAGDLDDPRPWVEAYAAGVGSPLELKFLRLFEKHGFTPQKQAPVAPSPGVDPISVADFAVPQRRLAIYIDGAAFHTGRNLRRDRSIRERLRHGIRRGALKSCARPIWGKERPL
jgi:hypothetical protein